MFVGGQRDQHQVDAHGRGRKGLMRDSGKKLRTSQSPFRRKMSSSTQWAERRKGWEVGVLTRTAASDAR